MHLETWLRCIVWIAFRWWLSLTGEPKAVNAQIGQIGPVHPTNHRPFATWRTAHQATCTALVRQSTISDAVDEAIVLNTDSLF